MQLERRPTILIVDDNVTNLKVLLCILRDQGFDTRPATSAQQALRMVTRQVPDLILLDINMPDIDGFELCRRVRDNSLTAHVPVIFLSAYSGDEIAEKCRAVGGSAYVTKPVDFDEVMLRIGAVLGELQRDDAKRSPSRNGAAQFSESFNANPLPVGDYRLTTKSTDVG